MATYEQVHAGDTVLGHDGNLWGVEAITFVPQIVVTLVRYERTITGYPPPGTPVVIVKPADVEPERVAAGVLIGAGFTVELIAERWER